MRYKYLVLLLTCFILCACSPASKHLQEVRSDAGDRVSVGKVQREIKIGMSSAQVVSVLGSPNIVTTDEMRRENWVYDKVATETAYSTSSGGIGALILGFADHGALAPHGGYNNSSGAKSTTQRTLTIILKFDADSKVRDFAYHNSSF